MEIPGRYGHNICHIDSCILIPLLNQENDEDLHRTGKHLINDNNKSVRISLTALGEAFDELSADVSQCQNAGEDYALFVARERIDIAGYKKRDEVLSKALRIIEIDNRITPADSLIIATALKDSDCRFLYTIDRDMLNSVSICDYAREFNVKISEPPNLRR